MSNSKRKYQIALHKVGFLAPIDAPSATIQVFVIDLKGKTITLTLAKDASVLTLKELVAQKTGIAVEQQRLIYAGKQLESQHSIQEYNIQKESNIHLTLRLRGGVGERENVQDFIQAEIVHGNVVSLASRDSLATVNIIRKKQTLTEKVKKAISFSVGYEQEELRTVCTQSLIVETMKGGNCMEMAYWAAAKLIEKTTNQWVYMCNLTGNFPIDPTIPLNDTTHPLYSHRYKRVSAGLDHVFVITYPTDTPLANMDFDKATVVDTWYDNLVCSLNDYMNREHPYYNYAPYTTNPNFTLNIGNIEVTQFPGKNPYKFKAIGTPFSNNKRAAYKAVGPMVEARDAFIIELGTTVFDNAIANNKYDFDNHQALRDRRSPAQLQAFLEEASKTKGAVEKEIATFKTVDEFDVILQSTHAAFLRAVAKTMVGLEEDVLNNFYTSIEKFPPALNNLFVAANAPLIELFVEHSGEAFPQFLVQFFNTLNPDKRDVFNSLPTPTLKQYTLASMENFNEVVTMKGILPSTSKVLNSMTEEEWGILSKIEEIEDADALIRQLMLKANKTQKPHILNALTPAQIKSFALKSKANFERVMMADAGKPFLVLMGSMKVEEWTALWGYYNQSPPNSFINELLELTEDNPLILQSLSERRFKSYTLRDSANFERVAKMKDLSTTFSELLSSLKAGEWKKLWERYTPLPSDDLLNHLLDSTKDNAFVLEQLPTPRWKEYVLHSANNLNRVLDIKDLQEKLLALMQALEDEDWTTVGRNYPHEGGKKKLVEQLTKMNEPTGQLADAKLFPE